MGTRTGEPGGDRARDTSRSRLARSSSPAVKALTSCERLLSTGALLPAGLLGQYGIKLAPQDGLDRGISIDALDSALKLAAVVPELERREGVEGMLGLVDGNGITGHR